jgi:hypothetical protein
MLMLFKMRNLKRTIACLALSLFAMTAAPADADYNRVDFTIRNASSYDIYGIFMSRSADENWHRDLLGTGVLSSGSRVSLTAQPDTYDLKLVDEDGDTCIVKGISVYQDKVWRITNSWLLGCEFH